MGRSQAMPRLIQRLSAAIRYKGTRCAARLLLAASSTPSCAPGQKAQGAPRRHLDYKETSVGSRYGRRWRIWRRRSSSLPPRCGRARQPTPGDPFIAPRPGASRLPAGNPDAADDRRGRTRLASISQPSSTLIARCWARPARRWQAKLITTHLSACWLVAVVKLVKAPRLRCAP